MNNCLIEIRAAAGGDEAKIWAADLLRMYLKFAQKTGWKTNLINDQVLRISGPEVYNLLKHEAGVHRVQRVPATERYGRIHTSTATVAVLPIIPEADIKINNIDLDWQFYRASSQGGQNVQKVSTAVRLIHKPTGLVVTCERERLQEQNRKIALELLRAKLWEKEEEKRQSQLTNLRRSAVGRGMRCEKIRTYNFPQSRVTDHRLGKSWYNLETILDGNLDKIFTAFSR
ncbi:MAG TPA: peptide chain release factor-like protein [Candidatus Bathyarchaeia archaeon]|nr:peptide chain release factor-like protein [Candidatus Bathyarchaeia archaeon]